MTNSRGGGGNWPFDQIGEPGGQPQSGPSGGAQLGAPVPNRPVAPSGFASERSAFDDDVVEPDSGGGRLATHRGGGPTRRRPPLWMLIVIGLVVVGLVVAAVVMLTRDKSDSQGTPVAATVTIPVPTATVEPIAREGGTAFQQALPSEVLAFALTEMVEHEPLLVSGAIEGWKLTYTDGAENVVVYAGQWRDSASAEAVFDAVLAANPVDAATAEATQDESGATATAESEPAPKPEQGAVEVDGQPVGRYLFFPRADGTASLWWTNNTVLLQMDGPATALPDLYAAFPL
jgi:hypothetical protein